MVPQRFPYWVLFALLTSPAWAGWTETTSVP